MMSLNFGENEKTKHSEVSPTEGLSNEPSLIATLTLSPDLQGPSLLLALLSILQLPPQAETASFIAVLPNVVTVCNT